MNEDTIQIDGKHTSAEIKTTNVDDYCIEQVQEIADHEAFQKPIKIMPDAHAGAGAVIGFTMELGERIVPNCVGVDIGCGMTAFNLGSSSEIDKKIQEDPRTVDEKTRDEIPLGFNTFGDVEAEQRYHIVNDFPWEVCEIKATDFNSNLPLNIEVDSDFGGEYFKNLCERIGYNPMRAINSIGTLGGGNHFIEISQSSETGDYWVVVHSGSRGIGATIADYWQERAHENCDGRAEWVRERLQYIPDYAYKFDEDELNDVELLNWVQGGMGEDWKDMQEVRDVWEDENPEEIGVLANDMKDISSYVRENSDGNELDYLDGEERAGYLKDMIFAQTYAKESRAKMCYAVADVLGVTPKEEIDSIHNYIDFDDLVIRKGATRVHEGELGVIPFNMRDGAVIVRGKGNEDWNRSAPHGAGRRGSRRWAYETFDVAEYVREMDKVFSTSVNEETLDEAPMAYKETDDIMSRMQETVEVEEELVPLINIKAE